MNLFVKGRKDVFKTLQLKINEDDQTIWFHCASLGEYEQGLPIMESVKKKFPNHKLVLTFFSPSGYEIKKNSSIADVVSYLPLDTPHNSKKFIKIVHPTLAIFIKYEFWPNYLFQLQKNNISSLLVSGLFRKSQVFFKYYGGFMRKALSRFDHLFVQDELSIALLHSIDIKNVSISGDTRFDRVSNQLKHDNSLAFIKHFKEDSLCIVCGSTWPEDEAVLLDYINTASKNVKFIIAPHKIDTTKIEAFRKSIQKKVILFSEKENKKLSEYSVLIVNTIGLLTKIYSYADIAYIGGAIGKTGLHNILEPATFGVPIVAGQYLQKFPEAQKLQEKEGLFSVSNSISCSQILSKLVDDKEFRIKTGAIAEHYINNTRGATKKVVSYIEKLNEKGII
jgi:3-deoxy-D-manno-octulosonic-acid transferase